MKHTFQVTAHNDATHIRAKDGVEGVIHEYDDISVVLPTTALVDVSDFTLIPPPPTPVTIPSEIANWRARAVLEIAGLLPKVDAAIASLDGAAGIVARTAWHSGASLVRHSPTVLAMTSALGLTSDQVDALFIQAETLAV